MNKKRLEKSIIRMVVATGIFGGSYFTTIPGASAETFENWLSGPSLTGDWGGVRTRLKDEGFTFKGLYVGEFADAFTGGNRQGAGYAQQFGFGVDVDLGKVADIDGGTFHLAFIQRQGRSASTDFTGNKLNFQEEYGLGEDFRMTALNYEQNFAKKTINIKVGYQSMGDDFEATTVACTFQNVGFCGHSQSLPNDSGWADYPSSRWGGRFKYYPTPSLYAETGVFDVNPTDSLGPNGLKVSLSGSTGVLVPVEFGLTTQFGPNALTGHYKLGGYYNSSSAKALRDTPLPTEMLQGRYGGYLSFDQMVWSPGPGNTRGLILFIQATLSDDRTATMPTYVDGGLVLRGPFASRPIDFFNFGFVRAGVNHHLINLERNALIAEDAYVPLQSGETLFEMGYGAKVTPWLLIHPNIQYDVNPGAFSYKRYPNAWAFGLQTSVIF